jgi:Holliday junction DNA helicase RuvA
MIGRLHGKLVDRDGSQGILDVGGVGYAIETPSHVLEAWLRSEEPVTVHVHTHVREDAIALYAFATKIDRDAFVKLLSVSGVGPKLALAALETMDLEALVQAIESDDLRALQRISGVGKKVAQRLALELKGKLTVGPSTQASGGGATPTSEPDTLPAALERLGYKRAEIERVRNRLIEEGVPQDAPIAQRLRAALKILYGNA